MFETRQGKEKKWANAKDFVPQQISTLEKEQKVIYIFS